MGYTQHHRTPLYAHPEIVPVTTHAHLLALPRQSALWRIRPVIYKIQNPGDSGAFNALMNVLRVNVAIPVPLRYSFVEKACVTLHLQTPHIAICRAVRSVRSNISRLLITIDCSTAMSRDLGDWRYAPITLQHSACWETPVCMPDDLPLVSCDRIEPAGLASHEWGQ